MNVLFFRILKKRSKYKNARNGILSNKFFFFGWALFVCSLIFCTPRVFPAFLSLGQLDFR
jgi:hypothetical protein